MPWRRSRERGLLLPRDRGILDPGAPLAQGLRSLWVPARGLTPTGLTNLVTDEAGTLDFGAGSAVPTFTSTDFGAGLSFDGVDDHAAKFGSFYQPSSSFPLTMAVALRLDVVPSATSVIYTFCSANAAFSAEINVRTNRTRIVFTGDGNTTSTVCDIPINPTPGQVALIVGVLDSYTTSRISLYEPTTGVFQSAISTAGTTTSDAAANSLDYEAIGAWYPGSASDFTAITVLDAWAWGRALSDQEIEHWRRDRWSVLRAPAVRTVAAPQQAPATAAAAQTLLLPTQTATFVRVAAGQQALTLPPVTQTTGGTLVAVAEQVLTLPSVTLATDVRMLAAAQASQTHSLPGQTAHAQAPAPGLSASQALALPAQAATVIAPAQAAAAQAIGLPAQEATTSAPDPSASSLDAAQALLPVTQAATAKTIRAAQATQVLARPTQTTAVVALAPVQTSAVAAQTLRLPTQSAVIEPFNPPVVIGPAPPDRPVEADPVLPATGDVDDIVARLADVLPPWFGPPGTVPPVLRVPLTMAASVGSWIYDLVSYARLQTRIRTATEGWLDLVAWDFFGTRIKRRAGQGDESFRRRILVEMFRARGTRPAMVSALRDLTGYEPRIFEPSRPQDVGGIGIPSGLAVGVAGAVGSIGLPGEVFITAFRDPDAGIPFAAGIGASTGAVGVPSFLVVGSLDQIKGALTDSDVYGVVEATRPVGTRVWVRIALGERTTLPPVTVPVPPA